MKMIASATLAVIGLLVVTTAAAAPTPLPSNINDTDRVFSPDLYQASCPQLPGIVRSAVRATLRRDVQITAGLLRIFFHACLPQLGAERKRVY
ncbi:hypothetical protein EJB05_31076, partial [Eragrostis curvula]